MRIRLPKATNAYSVHDSSSLRNPSTKTKGTQYLNNSPVR
jgi:hypothetical protein